MDKGSSDQYDFFTNVSHEFRTPLTLILGPIDQLIDECENPNHVKTLNSIKHNAQKLLDLTNQLLDLSKTDAGLLSLNPSPVNLNSLITNIASGFLPSAELKEIAIISEIQENLNVSVDINKFQTCIYNLLGNALKFTPKGGEISVKAFTDGADLIVHVSDSGIGIKPEKIPHIFDRFFQAEKFFPSPDGFIKNETGTGIGLAFVKTIVNIHGGTITVQSEPGSGTTFVINIPNSVTDEKPQTVETETKVEASEKNHFSEHKDENLPNLLLVEDTPEMRDFIAETIGQNFNCAFAANGQEGLDIANKMIPDIILSDVMMPVMDGIEMCAALKTSSLTCHIPVLMLTADAQETTKLKGLDNGADDFLTKPFNGTELNLRLKNLLKLAKNQIQHYERQHIYHGEEPVSLDDQFIKQLQNIIEDNLHNDALTADDIASMIGYSRTQVHRKLKAVTGKSITAFLNRLRLNKAKLLLEKNSGNISEIAYQVGFSSPGYFTRKFHEQFGKKPSEI